MSQYSVVTPTKPARIDGPAGALPTKTAVGSAAGAVLDEDDLIVFVTVNAACVAAGKLNAAATTEAANAAETAAAPISFKRKPQNPAMLGCHFTVSQRF
jgi:hypothetical protein